MIRRTLGRLRGFTLVEMLVGLFIALIASGIAFLLLRDEHSNYVSLRARVKMQSDARDALRLMEGELLNTGLDVGNIMAGGDLMTMACPHALYSATDSSSFAFGEGDPGDSIAFGQYLVDEDGLPNCENANVRWIRYWLRHDTLFRGIAPTPSMLQTAPDLPLIDNVMAFQVQYGLQAPRDVLWDSSNASRPTGVGLAVTDSGNGWKLTGWTNSPAKADFPARSLEIGDKIRVALRCRPNADFANTTTGWKTFVVGLDDGDLDTIRVYPGMTEGRRVEVEIINAEAGPQKLVVAGEMKANAGAPTVWIGGLSVTRTSQARYTWVDAPTTAQKMQVRAFRIFLLVRTREKPPAPHLDPWTGVGNLSPIDPQTSADGRTSVLFERVIPVVNNGH